MIPISHNVPVDGWLVGGYACECKPLQMCEGPDDIYSISRVHWMEKIRRKSTKVILVAYH